MSEDWREELATSRQKDFIRKLGGNILRGLTKAEAAEILDVLREGATAEQKRWLAFFKIRHDETTSKAEAADLIAGHRKKYPGSEAVFRRGGGPPWRFPTQAAGRVLAVLAIVAGAAWLVESKPWTVLSGKPVVAPAQRSQIAALPAPGQAMRLKRDKLFALKYGTTQMKAGTVVTVKRLEGAKAVVVVLGEEQQIPLEHLELAE